MCVDEIFAVEKILSGSCVAAESHAGSGIVAHVAVNHSLYVYGSTPLFGNLVHSAIYDGTLVHPRIEHRAYATPKLFPSRLGEVFACIFLYSCLETLHKLLEVIDIKLVVELHAFLLFHIIHNGLERIYVGLVLRFHAKHHVAVHLYKPAVAVPSKTRIAAFLCHGGHSGIVHTKIEHCVHHTGHRSTGTGTH